MLARAEPCIHRRSLCSLRICPDVLLIFITNNRLHCDLVIWKWHIVILGEFWTAAVKFSDFLLKYLAEGRNKWAEIIKISLPIFLTLPFDSIHLLVLSVLGISVFYDSMHQKV